jgi:hypothetical protein
MITAELFPNKKGAPCRTPLGQLQGLGSRCPGRGLSLMNSSASQACQYGKPFLPGSGGT